MVHLGPFLSPFCCLLSPFWLTFGGVWAFLETRPAGTPHLQTQNGPPLATKALKLANHQPIWPPAHGKAPWALQCPLQCTWFGPKFGLLDTLHIPQQFPPCPGTKMAKPIKTLRHHIVGGQLGCGLGLWTTTWQVSGVRKKWENAIEKKNIGKPLIPMVEILKTIEKPLAPMAHM